ncbi:MAG TPA: amidohydrolase family protein [Gemmatimonadaceae bacterium]|nr:amidohydrolase family protein [Gemmatimonadaceae bacterium]
MTPTADRPPAPLGGPGPLVDVHAHFYHAGCGRSDWKQVNESRLRAGALIGITVHVASMLGSFGHRSPTYFPSPSDIAEGNDEMRRLEAGSSGLVRSYVTVNPNDAARAQEEIARGVEGGAVGIKLAASRRADDPLLDPIAAAAVTHGLPILHHIWQHRTREWPGQEISDGADLGRLAARHPRAMFILAHIGGGGDWAHTFPAVADMPNVYLDISGSGVDRGMLDAALQAVGSTRLLWGSDITMETGLAKLRALEAIGLNAEEMADIRYRNAVRIFRAGRLLPSVEPTPARRARAERA